MAQSRAARSAPVCPPETILSRPIFTGFAACYAAIPSMAPVAGSRQQILSRLARHILRGPKAHTERTERRTHETSTIHVAHGAGAEHGLGRRRSGGGGRLRDIRHASYGPHQPVPAGARPHRRSDGRHPTGARAASTQAETAPAVAPSKP